MQQFTVFIDGAAGTTGLRIRERLAIQPDIVLLSLPEEQRKDLPARLAAVHRADASILCLPDAASAQLAAAADPGARIIDTSTAHRTAPGWVYGFAELAARRESIATAHRVAVPGCHATGFLALAAPLIAGSLLPAATQLSCHSLTGYSGGGRQMIEAYQAPNRPPEYAAPRLYGLSMAHKHLPEMQAVAGLLSPPLFCPVVADYYSGMLISLALPAAVFTHPNTTPETLAAFFENYYRNEPLITVHGAHAAPPDGTLAAGALAGKDTLEIFTLGNDQQILLAARLDNLGKGASGAAIQCLNLMLGRDETAGLCL